MRASGSLSIWASVLTFGIAAGLASAQGGLQEADGNHVSWTRFQQHGWEFRVIYTRANDSLVANNIFASSVPGTTSGNNIKAVWYSRSGSGWAAKSWEAANQYEAAKSVKAVLGVSSGEDWRWFFDDKSAFEAAVAANLAVDYSNGVLSHDAVAPYIESSAWHDDIVSFLKDVGYKAAYIWAEKTNFGSALCDATVIFNGMAEAVTQDVAMGNLSLQQVANVYATTTISICGAPPGDKGDVGIIRWSPPWRLPFDPNDPGTPHNDGCFDNWNV